MGRFLLFSLAIFSSISMAQVHDANLWTSVGLSGDLTDKFTLNYETQTRFYKNATTLDAYYNELGVDYSPLKPLTFSIDYRYSRKNKESYFEGIHRFCFSTTFTQKFDDLGLTFKARVRYQIPFNRLGVVNDNVYPDSKNVLRFKIGVKYRTVNLKWLQPFTSFEIYKGVKPVNQYNAIDSYRFIVGFTLDLPKRHSIDIYYMLEKEYRSVQQLNHIYVIQYNYVLFKDPIFKEPAPTTAE